MKAYGTIVADPPWRFGNKATRAAVQNHYQTLDAHDLSQLQLDGEHLTHSIADNAHLYLWTTAAHIEEALSVSERPHDLEQIIKGIRIDSTTTSILGSGS